MDQTVIKSYRQMCRTGFPNTGEIQNPDIFLDTVGEKIRICSHVSHAYMNIYIQVRGDMIADIKYLCTCDPTANVVVELLCNLVRSKSIKDAEALKEEDFAAALGGGDDEFRKRVRGMIELVHRGISRFKAARN